MNENHFQALTDPIAIFQFDFEKRQNESIPKKRQSIKEFYPKLESKCDAIFMW